MTDFLLELRSEEIPARMQDKARDDLARLFTAELEKAGLRADAIVTFATPRRLALIARDLPAETAAVSEEVKGPRVGAPPQALEGFLRKTGLTADQLVDRDGVLFAVIDKPGRKTAEVLAEAIPAIVRAFPWPKSMRWGAASVSTESLRWVRPLHGIVALLGSDVVPIEIAGVVSGNITFGHRFMHEGAVTISSAADYADRLRAAHVIVDQDERRSIIALGATMAARKAGLELVQDEGLLTENAGLTEWPVPLLGRFDEDFLSVPHEVIQLTARVNQKYFVCRIPPRASLGEGDRSAQPNGGGAPPSVADATATSPSKLEEESKLANAFICTANIDAEDGGVKIVEGNRKVLAARLSDARFFYETDLKVPLEEQAKKLGKIVFHERLGTVADKVERVAKLARWLVEEGIVKSSPLAGRGTGEAGGGGVPPAASLADDPLHRPADGPPPRAGEDLASLAERAARLCKADLVTGMVGEFPELQGLMGGYYAAAQGEPKQVADAIRDHYKPVGQGDDVPTAPVTVAVSLADKLDTLFGFFSIEEKPTGSKDPFALRRAGLGILALIQRNQLRIDAKVVFTEIASVFIAPKAFATGERASDGTEASAREKLGEERFQTSRRLAAEITLFLRDRLIQQQRDVRTRGDLIVAAFEGLGLVNDFVSLLARVSALQSFVGTEDGANLLAGYKRAANILKKEAPRAPAKAGVQDGSAPDDSGLLLSQEHGTTSLSYTPEPAEADLIDALDAAEPAAADAVGNEDFEAAMAALATLRVPIDAFFESVTVNDPDPDKRSARLALLARVRDAVHTVADFSKIEG